MTPPRPLPGLLHRPKVTTIVTGPSDSPTLTTVLTRPLSPPTDQGEGA